jgi:hypothetical protein
MRKEFIILIVSLSKRTDEIKNHYCHFIDSIFIILLSRYYSSKGSFWVSKSKKRIEIVTALD